MVFHYHLFLNDATVQQESDWLMDTTEDLCGQNLRYRILFVCVVVCNHDHIQQTEHRPGKPFKYRKSSLPEKHESASLTGGGNLVCSVFLFSPLQVSSRDEPFMDLSLDIEQNTSVTACLRSFSNTETLTKKNKFFCESCNALQVSVCVCFMSHTEGTSSTPKI